MLTSDSVTLTQLYVVKFTTYVIYYNNNNVLRQLKINSNIPPEAAAAVLGEVRRWRTHRAAVQNGHPLRPNPHHDPWLHWGLLWIVVAVGLLNGGP